MMRVRWLLVASVLVTVSVLGGGVGTAAAATGSATVAMYSDTGDYIGQGAQQLFIGAAGLTGSAGEAIVNVSGPNGASYTLDFAAPPGQALARGVYDNAARVMSRGTGQPGIDIYGDGRGCNTDAGRFEVKDVGFDSSGAPNRLWLIYEQHCEGAQPALFGEVRFAEPAGGGALNPVPTLVRWPANNYGTPETAVPVRFVASSPVTLSSVSIGGSNPSDFTIRSDGCSGRVLPAGGICDVWVRSTPSTAGLRTATLVVPDTAGHSYAVPLQAWTYGGTTRLLMNSDTGDYIGQGKQYSYDPSNSVIEVTGTAEKVSFWIPSDDWSGDFTAGQGDILGGGSTYTGAQRYPYNGTSPGLDITGQGRGCNADTGQFTVTEATYNPDGSIRTFGVRFEQHCEGAQPALRGEFDWRLGDRTPAAPWMNDAGGSSAGTSANPGSGSTGSGSPSGSGMQTSSTSSSSPAGSAKTTSPSTAGSASGQSGPQSAAARRLEQTLVRVRNDGLALNRALVGLHGHPSRAGLRHAAVAAIARLRQDVAALAKLLQRVRPAGGRLLTAWRRMETDMTSWEQALLLEQRGLSAPRVTAQTWQLDSHARVRGVTALKALVQFANQA